MHMRKLFLVCAVSAVLFFATSAVRACLNDRDTLANEANKNPDVLRIVTGRFERNPPLYYEMRITRVTAELQSNPALLSDYDDVAVACDRLGRDDEAIAWMGRKLAQLKKANAADPAVKEQQYSYNANVGTFWMHRWLRAGGDRKRIAEVNKARAYIRQALVIKPDAHFGREKFQLMVMDWVADAFPAPLKDYQSDLYTSSEPLIYQGQMRRNEIIKGMSGLIVVGNAWESVDMFNTLAALLYEDRYDYTATLAYYAELRCQELIDQGRGSMMPDSPKGAALTVMFKLRKEPPHQASDLAVYRELRAEADNWQKRRTDYMMVRLRAGRHPDTDPTFWNDWHDPGPPHIRNPMDEAIYLALGAPLGIEYYLFWPRLLMFLLVVVFLVRHIRRRRLARIIHE
jgi:hypothetical protein